MRTSIGSLIAETLSSIWSRSIWATTTVMLAVGVGFTFGSLVAHESENIAARAEVLDGRGWGLITVSSATGETIDGHACDLARTVDGVLSAGAIGETRQSTALGVDAGLSITAVSPESAAIAWPDGRLNGSSTAVVTSGLHSLTGLGEGELYIVSSGAVTPVRTTLVSGPGRYAPLDGGLLLFSGGIDAPKQCIVSVQPERAESMALQIASATVAYDTVAVPVLSAVDSQPTPADLVQEHRQRHFPTLAAAALAAISALRLLRSRRDGSIYRLLGFGRIDLWAMGMIEYLLLLAMPFGATASCALLFAHTRGVPTEVLGARDLALSIACSAGVAVAFATLCAMGRNTHQFAPGA